MKRYLINNIRYIRYTTINTNTTATNIIRRQALSTTTTNTTTANNYTNNDTNILEKITLSLKNKQYNDITMDECRKYLTIVNTDIIDNHHNNNNHTNDIIDGIFICMKILNHYIDNSILARSTKQPLTLTELCVLMKTLNKYNCNWKRLSIYERNIFTMISYKAIGKGFRNITSFAAYLYGLIAIKADYKSLPNVISISIINALAACPANAWKSSSSSSSSSRSFKKHELFKPICNALLKLNVPYDELPHEFQEEIRGMGIYPEDH